MKIQVTAEDIELAHRKCCWRCPIALALRRHWPHARVYDDAVGWWAQLEERTRFYPLPIHAGLFASLFDSGEEVAPFEFEFQGPGE